jgi:hypothetical protein
VTNAAGYVLARGPKLLRERGIGHIRREMTPIEEPPGQLRHEQPSVLLGLAVSREPVVRPMREVEVLRVETAISVVDAGQRDDTSRTAVASVSAMLAGPSVAGILLTGLVSGRAGLRELLSRLLRWRVGAGWYAVALFPAPLLAAAVSSGSR